MATVRSARWGRVPQWITLLLAVACILVGATLVTRPFRSLAVLILLIAAGFLLTGLLEFVRYIATPDPRPSTIAGIGEIMLGVAVLLWLGFSLRVLTLVVGIALIGSGAARAFEALRGSSDDRIAALLLGSATTILGILALLWPDITLLVVALLFGVYLVCFGLARLVDAFRSPTGDAGTAVPRPPDLIRRFMRTAGAALALLVALALAALTLWLNRSAPVVDEFYTPPAQLPATPGALLRSEPMDRGVPASARMWRILYTTTQADGIPALASGLVIAPASPSPGPRPVIAWAHGTTGVDQTCAPSLLDDPFAAGAMPALNEVIAKDWVVVATDYIGLGTGGSHAYLIGQPAGRAVLDGVRAARQLPELSLAEQTVVWGHSQGGGAALWSGILAPSYAPDANVIGVAALAPASDLPSLVSNLDVVKGGAIFASYVTVGFSDSYPDVRFDDYVRPSARILVLEMAERCLAEPAILSSVVESLVIDSSIWSRSPLDGPFGARLKENIPTGPIPVPLLIGQGLGDELVLPAVQQAYAAQRCETGGQVEYRTYEGFDHVGVVGADSPLVPDLLAWTQDRFAGKAATSTC